METATVPGLTLGAFESKPGANAETLIPMLDAATAHKGYVIVQVGTNNLLGANTPEQALSGVEALWDGIAARGGVPVAALVPPNVARGEQVVALNNLITSAASARGLHLIDVYTVVADDKGNWNEGTSNDGVHGNDAGADLMAHAAFDQLKLLAE